MIMPATPQIRRYIEGDADGVRDLFIIVNRLLAPPEMKEQFEAYIERSLREEMGRIADYYSARDGGFWVATDGADLLGMFGLECSGPSAMELRRMYVAPRARRRGIGRFMLQFAEEEWRRRGFAEMVLSTSELQQGALALYRANGFRLLYEEDAQDASNKTVGGGIRRYHFRKLL